MRAIKYAILLVAGIVLVGIIYAHRGILSCGHDDYSGSLAAVEGIRGTDPGDVTLVRIVLDGEHDVELSPHKDSADIRRLMKSLRSIRVKHGCDHVIYDTICILWRKPVGTRSVIRGRFDPDSAPRISSSMESDDLGAVVYDIFKRRGIEPR